MKNISTKTRISVATIKKWYCDGKSPYLGHFLILVQSYPAILRVFLAMTGHGYLIPHIQQRCQEDETTAQVGKQPLDTGENVLINVPINVLMNSWPEDLHERQVWFLAELSRNIGVAAKDIVQHHGVKDKTARRDIADLKMRKLIRLKGARRTGIYVLLPQIERK